MSLEKNSQKQDKSKNRKAEETAMVTGKQLGIIALIFVLLSVCFFLLLKNRGTVSDFFGLKLATETQTLYSAVYYDDGDNPVPYVPQNVRGMDSTKIYVPVVVDTSTYKDVELSELAEYVLAEAVKASEHSENASAMVKTANADVDKYCSASFMKEVNSAVRSANAIARTDEQIQRAKYLETLLPVLKSAVSRVENYLPDIMSNTLKVTDMALTLRSLFRVVAGDNPTESQLVMAELKTKDISKELNGVVMPLLDDTYSSEQSDAKLIQDLYDEIMRSYEDISQAVSEMMAKELAELTSQVDALLARIDEAYEKSADRRLESEDLYKSISGDLSYEQALGVKNGIKSGIEEVETNLDSIKECLVGLTEIAQKRPDSDSLAASAKSRNGYVDDLNKWLDEMRMFYDVSWKELKDIIASGTIDHLFSEIAANEAELMRTLDEAESAYMYSISRPDDYSTAIASALILEDALRTAQKVSDRLDVNESDLEAFVEEYGKEYPNLMPKVENALESIEIARNIIDDIRAFVDSSVKSEPLKTAHAEVVELLALSESDGSVLEGSSKTVDSILDKAQKYLDEILAYVDEVSDALKEEKTAVDPLESKFFMKEAKNSLDDVEGTYGKLSDLIKEVEALYDEALKREEALRALSEKYPDSARLRELAEEGQKNVEHIRDVLDTLKNLKVSAETSVVKSRDDYKAAVRKNTKGRNEITFALSPYGIDFERLMEQRYNPGADVIDKSSYGFGGEFSYFRKFGDDKFTLDLGVSIGADYYLYLDNRPSDGRLSVYNTRLVANLFANVGITVGVSEDIDFKFNVGFGVMYNKGWEFTDSGSQDEYDPEGVKNAWRPALSARVGVAIRLTEKLYLDIYARGMFAFKMEQAFTNDWWPEAYKHIAGYVGITYKF